MVNKFRDFFILNVPKSKQMKRIFAVMRKPVSFPKNPITIDKTSPKLWNRLTIRNKSYRIGSVTVLEIPVITY